ncbi:MAG: endonuclease/exonuclease/phosphatase family protein [Salinibacter sp.]
MRTTVRIIGGSLGVLLVGLAGFFFWASGGRLSDDALRTSPRYASPAPSPDTLTVATYNIGYLSGMTNNEPVVRPESLFTANMEAALTLLQEVNADVVGLQEIDFGAARSFYKHQLDTLATRLNYATAARAVNWDVRYLPFPYGRPAVHFGRVLSGQAVLSRRPMRMHRRYVLPRPPLPFYRDAFYLDRLAQATVVAFDDKPLVVLNVHLEAYDAETRTAQARQVRALYDRVAQPGVPVLLLGDFNAAIDAPEDSTMAVLLDETNLRPARPDTASAGTFPADAPTRTIDHILYRSGPLTSASATVHCGPQDAPPSDHCAVRASLTMDSTAAPPALDSVRALLPPTGRLDAD